MKHNTMHTGVNKKSAAGFSLVEVVVAVGIFALAIVGVIGLLVPTSKNIADVADSDSASRVINAIQSGLQGSGFSRVRADMNKRFFATKDGSKVGAEDRTNADGSNYWLNNQEKFFEFRLVRNESLSPSSPATADDAAGFLAFTIVLRWPAYAPSADGAGTPVNDAQKSVMVVPAAVTR